MKPVLVQKNFGKSSLAAATESDNPSNSEYLGNVFNFNLFRMLNDNYQFYSLLMCEPPVEDFKSSAIWFSNRVDLDIDERTRPNNQTIFILLHIVGLNESPLWK